MEAQNEVLLIVAHGHPEFIKGGAEVASYNLFKGFKRSGTFDKVVYLARVQGTEHASTPFGKLRDDEYLFASNTQDYFLSSQDNKSFLWKDFAEFLNKLNPTVIHFHHYVHIGTEAIKVAKNWNPNVKVYLTLHEYNAICFNSGQMIKTDRKTLCEKSGTRECGNCFPDLEPSQFLLRKIYFQSIFENVDLFISPSFFLKSRYVDWGLPADKIKVIENLHLPPKSPNKPVVEAEEVVQFGFFGQINPFKGVEVLLKAANILSKQGYEEKFHLHLFGANLDKQDQKFQDRINKLLEDEETTVSFQGAYNHTDLSALMNQIHVVIVPSIWWENSPMVIQEALLHKRPLIGSNIGGVAEKIKHKVNGFHFLNGNPFSLADQMKKFINQKNLVDELSSNISSENISEEVILTRHLEAYKIEVE